MLVVSEETGRVALGKSDESVGMLAPLEPVISTTSIPSDTAPPEALFSILWLDDNEVATLDDDWLLETGISE